MRTLFIYMLLFLSIVGCKTNDSKTPEIDHEHAATEKYRCPMHLDVIQGKPGKCPVCGMDLVKVTNEAVDANLMFNDTQIRLANITTQKVSIKPIGQTIAVNGRFTADELQSEVISSRAPGRIEKLYIKETGQPIQKGQPLYTLYSEMLLTLQQEYLLAKEQYETLGKTEKRYKTFLESSEKKLLLYGLTKNQINQLTGKNSLHPQITFLAPASGVVTEINISEGQSVQEGTLLYKIEDFGKLWVEAELYPNEAAYLKMGDRINVGDENPIQATVSFMSPEYRANTQIMIMRASIDNPESRFKPGEQIQIYLTHSAKQAIAVPVDAVIREGKRNHVFVQKGHNTFQPRRVKTGIENFSEVEITDGLTEGDTVVVSGGYLLYSEIVLKKGRNYLAEY